MMSAKKKKINKIFPVQNSQGSNKNEKNTSIGMTTKKRKENQLQKIQNLPALFCYQVNHFVNQNNIGKSMIWIIKKGQISFPCVL